MSFNQATLPFSSKDLNETGASSDLDTSSIVKQPERGIINCTLKRRSDYQGFGISLSANSKQISKATDEKLYVPIITNVEPNSPGEYAGLLKNDLILEINGVSTYKQSSETIANMIRSSGEQVQLVISRDKTKINEQQQQQQATLELARESLAAATMGVIISQNNRVRDTGVFDVSITQIPQEQQQQQQNEQESPSTGIRRTSRASLTEKRSRSASPQVIKTAMTMSSSKVYPSSPGETTGVRTRNLSEPPSPIPRDAPVPRLCRVRTYEPSLGFVVAGSKTRSGIYKITEITPNSPAYNSGLRNNDYIIEVSGVTVDKLNYDQVINLIKLKKDEDDLQLLVADRDTLEYYRMRDASISSQIVPKLTYIETLLQDELQFNLTDSLNTTHRISQESLNALERKYFF